MIKHIIKNSLIHELYYWDASDLICVKFKQELADIIMLYEIDLSIRLSPDTTLYTKSKNYKLMSDYSNSNKPPLLSDKMKRIDIKGKYFNIWDSSIEIGGNAYIKIITKTPHYISIFSDSSEFDNKIREINK